MKTLTIISSIFATLAIISLYKYSSQANTQIAGQQNLMVSENKPTGWGLGCNSKPGCLAYGLCKSSYTLKTLSKPIDVKKYIGRWHEQARTPQAFQKSQCAVADYGMGNSNEQITVWNHALDASGEEIRGTATSEGDNRFALVFNLFARGQYWILDIEEDAHGNYDWALVGDPCRESLYILSRSLKVDRAKVDAKLKFFKEQGGYGFNDETVLYRNSDC